jgi:hypothetical protein
MNTTRYGYRLFKGKSKAYRIAVCKVVMKHMALGLSFAKACEKFRLRGSHIHEFIHQYGLAEEYAKARNKMYDVLAEEIEALTLAPIERAPDGKLDPTALGQRKLQIEARRWYLGKVTKRYSDKSQIELSGEITQNTRIVPPFADR